MDEKLLGKRFKISSKPHVCSLCKHGIEPGRKYRVYTSAKDGRIYSFLLCDICQHVVKKIYQYSNENVLTKLNKCISGKQVTISNRNILQTYIDKYLIGKLGNSTDEIYYKIDNDLKKEG